MNIRGVDVVAAAKGTFKEFREDDLQGRAAEVAYNVLFSVVPLLIFLTALSGFVARAVGADDAMHDITRWLFDHMGTNQAVAVREPIEKVVESSNGGLLSFGALLSLWGGKNAVAALMKALNVAFDAKETRSWPTRNLVAIALTTALGVALILTSTMFIVGAGFAEDLTNKIGLGDTWLSVWSILRWPVMAAIIAVAVAALYWAAPDVDAPFRWLTPGSVLTVVVWGVVSLGLGFYFANFAGYAGGAYGALGGVLAFVFWLYLMTLILLFGAELNAVLTAQAAVLERTPSEEADHAEMRPTGPETRQSAEAPAVQSVPRGTYTPDPVGFAVVGKVGRSVATRLSKTALRAVKGVRKLRSYTASRDLIARR